MAQNVFILSAEEYAQIQGMAKRIEQLEDIQRLHDTMLAERNETIAYYRQRRKELLAKFAEQREVIASDNKELATKAHELLCKEAELANLSSALKEAKRDCESTSRALSASRQAHEDRIAEVENLKKEVFNLKHRDRVCIATDPKTGTTKVVSVVKADTYRQFGWTVSEEYLVDRPA